MSTDLNFCHKQQHSTFVAALVVWAASMLLSSFLALIGLSPNSEAMLPELGFYSMLSIVVMTPVVETLLYQTLVIELCRKVGLQKPLLQVVFSGLCFGATHYYSSLYMLYATLMGLLLAGAYVCRRSHTGWLSPSLMLMLSHALFNATALALTLL